MSLYTRESTIDVFPFSRQHEGDEVIIGRSETGTFLVVPPEAVEVLDQLAQGKSFGEVQDAYLLTHGEILDLEDFLGVLTSKGLIRSSADVYVDASPQETATRQVPQKTHHHFSAFPQSVARIIFSRTSVVCAVLLTAFAGLLICIEPSITTGPGDLYFPDHRMASVLSITAASYLALFVHELAHLIGARAEGVNSRMGISHRLWVLVAETDLTGLWSLPRGKRYLPLLAGLVVDFISCDLLLIGLYLQTKQMIVINILVVRLMRAMVFTYYMRIVWQCLLFLRTDLYYVIANYLNCKNLLRDTEVYLRNRVAYLIPGLKKRDQSNIPISELQIIRWYSWIWVAGRIAAILLLVVVTIPVTIRYIKSFIITFRAGPSNHPADFVDALLLTAYFLIPIFIGMGLWINAIVRREGVIK